MGVKICADLADGGWGVQNLGKYTDVILERSLTANLIFYVVLRGICITSDCFSGITIFCHPIPLDKEQSSNWWRKMLLCQLFDCSIVFLCFIHLKNIVFVQNFYNLQAIYLVTKLGKPGSEFT